MGNKPKPSKNDPPPGTRVDHVKVKPAKTAKPKTSKDDKDT